MPLFRYVVFVVTLLCSQFFLPIRMQAVEEEYISISKQGTEKIALALRKLAAQGRYEIKVARNLDAIIFNSLDFTGLVAVNSSSIKADGSDQAVIKALTSVAAEVYAAGSVSVKSGMVTLDMKVYDIPGAKLLFRKTYTGNEKQLRNISHAFCADLVERLTGKRSVFGSKIVFVSTKTGFKEIYQCDFDGQGVEQVTNTASISLTPALSPDGKYLAYTDFSTGRPSLAIRTLTDGKTARVAQSGNSIDPSWRNSRELATTLSFEGDQEIYLLKSEGVLYRRLTTSRGIDISPSFSPDGNKMVFVSQRNGAPQLFIEDILSGMVTRLTFSGEYNTQPSWSPSGDKIAFTTCENRGEINIFTINIDGSGMKQLTTNAGQNESPSWSPDGDMIVFTSNRQGKKQLYIMNQTGKNQRILLQMKGEQMQPSWSLFRK